jgi:hypothetical protein
LDISVAAWLVVVAAIAAANLPFVNERAFGFIPLQRAGHAARGAQAKPFVVRILELVVLYFIVGALAHALESRIGNAFAQTWEFYAITGPMFVVLAFPGFVLRYLRKRRG